MPFTRTMSSKPLKSQKNKSIKKIGGMFSFKSNKVSSKYLLNLRCFLIICPCTTQRCLG